MFTWIRIYASPWSRNVLNYGFLNIIGFFAASQFCSSSHARHQKSLLDIISYVQSNLLGGLRWREGFLSSVVAFWRLCSVLSPCPALYVAASWSPWHRSNFAIPLLKKLRGSTLCKFKAQYVPQSHSHSESPEVSTFLDFPCPPPSPVCLPWYTLCAFPAPGFRSSRFLHLPDEVCPPLKVHYRFSYSRKLSLFLFIWNYSHIILQHSWIDWNHFFTEWW